MLIRLALETKPHHAVADADRLALLDEPTLDRYRAFLTAAYTFEARYEQALVQAPGLDPQIIRRRMKAHRLRDDLHALGMPEPTARAPIPTFRSEAQALGWLYVVERNTLLHGLVRRHLERVLPGAPCSYLAAYGDTPGAMYRDLGNELDDVARRVIPSEIVLAACEAFEYQHAWFEALEPYQLAA